MGKGHRHLKKLKSEKAKVKLKGSKHLPKGTNVTDTTFKVKQIVIREQLKAANEAEPLSKRKLNIKELLNRLQHYNTTVKNDAITDLKEIVTLYPAEVVIPNLSQLFQGVSHLVLDKEKNIRLDALKLIALILSQVSVEQISPFFDILSSYFRCAMTHIDTAIQEDSLLLLDTLLTYTPSLVAADSNKILENFFDLISKLRTDSKPGRTLTVNLNSKITTVKWRVKVLNRLNAMLEAILNVKLNLNENQTQNNNHIDVKYNSEQLYYPVYTKNYLIPIELNINNSIKNNNDYENNVIKYIDVLIPLLFETWLEVGPGNKKENTNIDVSLTEEANSILNCILNIIQLLYNFLKLYEKNTSDYKTLKDFISKYSKDFSNFIVAHFPYTKITIKKRKRNEKSVEKNLETYCIVENLMICNIFCIFNKKITITNKTQQGYAEKLLIYVQNIFSRWHSDNDEQNKHAFIILKTLLLDISTSWKSYNKELSNILKSSIDLYYKIKSNNTLKSEVFNILCEIVNYDNFNKLPEFQTWLNSLPQLLCQTEISEKTVNMISQLIKQNNIMFKTSMNEKFNNILENLSKIKITNTNDELKAKYKIIGLSHYILSDNIFSYVNTVFNSDCDEMLKIYLKEILLLKFEGSNDLENAAKLRSLNWETNSQIENVSNKV